MPKALMEYVTKLEIKRVINSAEEAVSIDIKIDNALKIAKSNLADATKRALIKEELEGYIELRTEKKSLRYFDAVELYLEQSRVSEREQKNRIYFFNELLPNLLQYVFEKNPVTKDITSTHLNKIAVIIQKLPSRNHLNLKRVSTYKLICNTMKGEYKNNKKLHVDTVNKHIKRIRSLALYGFRTGLFSMTTAIATVKHRYSARDCFF